MASIIVTTLITRKILTNHNSLGAELVKSCVATFIELIVIYIVGHFVPRYCLFITSLFYLYFCLQQCQLLLLLRTNQKILVLL